MSNFACHNINSKQNVKYVLPDRSGDESLQFNALSPDANKTNIEEFGTGRMLCTHDGVLLKKSSAEHILDLNSSGSLSLVEYYPPRRLFIEWRPNENILISNDTNDQSDWALVDTISNRSRTNSEPNAEYIGTSSEKLQSSPKPRIMRILLDTLAVIEVKHRGQTLRFMRKSDHGLHSEFFFQHANADQFVQGMRNVHVIEMTKGTRGGSEEYIILQTDTQKLKRTFAELDIGEIKASSLEKDSWLPNKVMDFLVNIPDYVTAKTPPKERPGSLEFQQRLRLKESVHSDNWVGLSKITSNTNNSESPEGNLELENNKEVNRQVISPLPERPTIQRGSPLSENQWLELQESDGRIFQYTKILDIIFKGGIESNLRFEVWKYLLNYYQWNENNVERIVRRKQKSVEYYNMKAQWLAMTPQQEANFTGYRERKCQIEKDVKRTDRSLEYFAGEDNPNLHILQSILMTYVMYNFDLGYVQGMSDILAPILAIMENEVDAFWCFVGFMDRIFNNFDIDQAGMKTQFQQLRRLLEFCNPRLFNYLKSHDSDNMFFCFRWLLVWYKREFSNDDILKLWEVLFTNEPCTNFHLFVSIAILDQQTDIIIDNQYEFTDILKHVNELSETIDLKQTLELAESIYQQVKKANSLPNDIRQIIGEACLSPQNSTSSSLSQSSNAEFEITDMVVGDISSEEKDRQRQLLEEAFERSLFLQYM